MRIDLYLCKLTIPAVSVMACGGIRLEDTLHPVDFVYDFRGRMLVGGKWFLARDYEVVNWTGGPYGAGWISLDMSDIMIAKLINYLRGLGWQATLMPVEWLETWEYGRFYNTDVARMMEG